MRNVDRPGEEREALECTAGIRDLEVYPPHLGALGQRFPGDSQGHRGIMVSELLLVLKQGLAARCAQDSQFHFAVGTRDTNRHPARAEVNLGLVDNHRQLPAHQGVEVDLAVLGLAIHHASDAASVVVLAGFSVENHVAGFADAHGAQVLAHVLAIFPVQHHLDAPKLL